MTVQELKASFVFAYNQEPDAVYFAPGRIYLIGEHINYNNSCITTALCFGIYLLLRKNNEKQFRFWSLNEPEAIHLNLSQIDSHPKNTWIEHPLNAINQFISSNVEIIQGYDMLFWGNIQKEDNISTSEGLERITTFAMKDQHDKYSNNKNSFLNFRDNEHKFSFLNWDIIIGDTNVEIYKKFPIKEEGVKIVISNTHTPHKYNAAPYSDRISECKLVFEYLNKIRPLHDLDELSEDEFNSLVMAVDNPTAIKAAYHIISEVHRTKKAAIALKEGDLTLFGMLMNASHESLRDNFEIVSPEIESMVAQAWKIDGVIGSRMTGCGLGACTISLVREEVIDTFIEQVGAVYESQTGIKPEFYIAVIGDSACKLK